MNTRLSHLFVIILAAVAIMVSSCSGTKEPSALIDQSTRISAELDKLAEESPMFLSAANASYADGVLSVNIDFNSKLVNVNDCSEALVQYVLAQYLKNHTGENLDTVINTLTKEEGKLVITLSDATGNSREYTVGAARLKQLVRLKPMELSYNDVRTNVADIMASECPEYMTQQNAQDCEFAIAGGFAQYTLTFTNKAAFNDLSQAKLTGRYLKVIQSRYDDFGRCRPMIEELLKSLSIDGYRFVYTTKDGTKTLSAGMPWRLINK